VLLLALIAFTVTRGVRLQDDVVNTVVVSERISPGEVAEVSFETTVADERVDVLITDTDDRPVRALQLEAPLGAGSHSFEWDGTAEDGGAAAAGSYGIRVILREQGRDIKPPGRIEVTDEEG
jgi:flagellar hook assembly protein FlgD